MKKLISITLITAAIAVTAHAQEARNNALDHYWAERGYHREGNIYREDSCEDNHESRTVTEEVERELRRRLAREYLEYLDN